MISIIVVVLGSVVVVKVGVLMKLQSCGVVLLCLLICSSCVSEKENAPQSSNQTQVQSQNEKTNPTPIEQVESNSAP